VCLRASLLAAALAASTLAAAPDGATPSALQLFLRNSGSTCPGAPFLDVTPGEGEPGCGFIGGAPIGELSKVVPVFGDTVATYDLLAPVDELLDATRPLEGVNTIVATGQTNRTAIGQVRVDVTVRATFATGGTTTLGSDSTTMTWLPTQQTAAIPFSIDLDDALDGRTVTRVSIDVDVRGLHVLTGYHRLNGQSSLTLPTYELPEDPEAGQD
jgi:hypothetical protein